MILSQVLKKAVPEYLEGLQKGEVELLACRVSLGTNFCCCMCGMQALTHGRQRICLRISSSGIRGGQGAASV